MSEQVATYQIRPGVYLLQRPSSGLGLLPDPLPPYCCSSTCGAPQVRQNVLQFPALRGPDAK